MVESYYKPCRELDICNELIEKYFNTQQYEKCFEGHLALAEQGYPLAECQIGYFYYDGDMEIYWDDSDYDYDEEYEIDDLFDEKNYRYYEDRYIDEEGNLYYYAEEVSWNHNGEIITEKPVTLAMNDICAKKCDNK